MRSVCPCSSGKPFAECCAPLLAEEIAAQTPQALMRSRYTAFTLGNMDYIAKTMRSPAADNFDLVTSRRWAQSVAWKSLEILNHHYQDDEGSVEFVASFIQGHQLHRLHEISYFKRMGGQWFYTDGKQIAHPPVAIQHVGRNDPCPCKSGKKFKKCCGNASNL